MRALTVWCGVGIAYLCLSLSLSVCVWDRCAGPETGIVMPVEGGKEEAYDSRLARASSLFFSRHSLQTATTFLCCMLVGGHVSLFLYVSHAREHDLHSGV